MGACQDVRAQIVRVMARNLLSVLFVVSLTEYVICIVRAVEEHRHAFIQTDSELRYLVDGISLHLHESLGNEGEYPPSITEEDDKHVYSSPVTFYPPILDFKDHPIGMPHLAKVVVSNPNHHINVFFLSISGSTVHFHCSFFQEKVVPPGGNTTFDVVFLSREEGHVHNTLYIHTSVGSFKYEVYGMGTSNPYRLRPFLGAKVPVNSIYSPVITMYNPHSSTLQVTEMYSSGGDLHLELPSGEQEASKQLWEIPPYKMKSVMKASFIARVESNHSAFIRIKTNSSQNEYLVLPVEVEVSSAPGLYATSDVLDFGVMYSKDKSRSLPLNLLNHGQKPVQIVGVSANPSSSAITVEFQPVRIPPDTTGATQVATVTFHPNKATVTTQFSGKIMVRTKGSQLKLVVPFRGKVLHGSLEYNSTLTEFYVGDSRSDEIILKPIRLTNTFNVSIVIFNAELPEASRHQFEVHLQKNMVLHPNQTLSIGFVKLTNYTSSVRLSTYLRLHTNISHFDVPLLCYNGKLSMFVPTSRNAAKMEVGTIGLGEVRNVLFAVINSNPIGVRLKRFGATLVHTVVELLAVGSGNLTNAIEQNNFSGMNKSLLLGPSQFAIFRVGVMAPNVEENFVGEIFVETQYENLQMPFKFRTAKGSLAVVPHNLTFDSSFPGKISKAQLQIMSTFSQPMTVTSITPIPRDDRFFYSPAKKLPVLAPNAKTSVGNLMFDMERGCGEDCYTGIDEDSVADQQWVSGLKLPHDIALLDAKFYDTYWARWRAVSNSQTRTMNVTFAMDTTEVRNFMVQALVSLTWPKLALKNKLMFPLTQIGNYTVKELVLTNPSSVAIIVHLVPLSIYPNADIVIDSLRNSGILNPFKDLSSGGDCFRLQEPMCAKTQTLSSLSGIVPHPLSLLVRVEAGRKVRIPIQFVPFNDTEQTSVLLIRNNLTILDAVVLQGVGAEGQLRFGNRMPGSPLPLQLELTEKHLRDCDLSAHSRPAHFLVPNFTVRRAFTIRNTGQLPIYVDGFDIESLPCEGYGFSVLNCHGFLLSPNASRKVDIAFTPDFTLSKVQRTLNIHSSLGGSLGGALNFTLVANVPPYLLARCGAALPRPPWENALYYLGVGVTILLLCCVTVTAYFESERIVHHNYVAMTVTAMPTDGNLASPEYDCGRVFDLKSIGADRGGSRLGRVSKATATELEPAVAIRPIGNRRKTSRGTLTSDRGSSDLSFADSSVTVRTKKKGGALHHKKTNVGGSGDGGRECNIRPTSPPSVSVKGGIGHWTSENAVAAPSSPPLAPKRRKKKSVAGHLMGKGSTVAVTATTAERTCPVRSSASVATTAREPLLSHQQWPLNPPERNKSTRNNSGSNCTKSLDVAVTTRRQQQQNQSNNHHQQSQQRGAGQQRGNLKGLVLDTSFRMLLTEEETSSTTTDSSSPDLDSSEKEHKFCGDSGNKKNIWPKETELPDRSSGSSKFDEADDEGEFEVLTKTRSRRVRDHRKSTNSVEETPPVSPLEPSNKPKLPGVKSTLNKVGRWKERDVMQVKPRIAKKVISLKQRAVGPFNDGESSSTGKDSPPPLWDPPKLNTDDAYTDLAKQTQSFAMRTSQALSRRAMKAEQSAGGSTSIVKSSGGPSESNWATRGDTGTWSKPKGPPPVGKIAPEPKQVNAKILGPVGQKPASSKSLPLSPPDVWNSVTGACLTSPIAMGSPCTPEPPGNFYLAPFLNYGVQHQHQSATGSAHHLEPSSSTWPSPAQGIVAASTDPFAFENCWRTPVSAVTEPPAMFVASRQNVLDGSEDGWLSNTNISSSGYGQTLWDNDRSFSSWLPVKPGTADNISGGNAKQFVGPRFDPFSSRHDIWSPATRTAVTELNPAATATAAGCATLPPSRWADSLFATSPVLRHAPTDD